MMNKRLLREAIRMGKYMPIAMAYSVFNAIFIAVNAYALALIVNEIFFKKGSLNSAAVFIMAFIVNTAVKSLFNFILDDKIKKYSEEIKAAIKLKTFNNLINTSPINVKGKSSGDILTTLTEGTELLTAYFSQYIPQLFSSVIMPLIIFIVVFCFDKISATIMLITYPIIPFFMILIGARSKALNEKQWKKLTSLSSHFQDMLQGLRTLKVFGRSNAQEQKIYDISESYREATMAVLRVSFLSALVLETASTICTAIIAVNLGLRLLYGQIEFLQAFFILVITPDFYSPMRQLGLRFHASLNGDVAIDKIDKLNKEFNVIETTSNIDFQSENNSSNILEIKALSFSHDWREALKEINLIIGENNKVAIVGPSGSGKSTLINILSGFILAEDNRVFYRENDLNKIKREEWQKRIAIVPQNPHIFNMTVKENILLGNKSISESEFEAVCKLTKIADFVQNFNEGYATPLGDGAIVEVSGGEKQRIAMARAILKNTPIIILDEPTSALDPATEEIITNIINNELKDKTVIIAAHRLNTIKASHKIVVMDKGQIVESGSHEELLQIKGKYWEMIKVTEVEA